jgi:MYXO-CTERM domain-containing protein
MDKIDGALRGLNMNNNWMLLVLVLGGLFLLRRTPTATANTETVRLAQQAGVPVEGFWDRPASETGSWY